MNGDVNTLTSLNLDFISLIQKASLKPTTKVWGLAFQNKVKIAQTEMYTIVQLQRHWSIQKPMVAAETWVLPYRKLVKVRYTSRNSPTKIHNQIDSD